MQPEILREKQTVQASSTKGTTFQLGDRMVNNKESIWIHPKILQELAGVSAAD
jgi:hypothetical protein